MGNAFHFGYLIFKTFSVIFLNPIYTKVWSFKACSKKIKTLQNFNFQIENPLGSVGIDFPTQWESA
jgi:hypothetical protein